MLIVKKKSTQFCNCLEVAAITTKNNRATVRRKLRRSGGNVNIITPHDIGQARGLFIEMLNSAQRKRPTALSGSELGGRDQE